ncbi:MAG TPA: hypothetical protein VFH22_13615, partial [Rhodocyclaceae bacterium]|nr:hypothetical protein [Rhodocyclaceae bacterium]
MTNAQAPLAPALQNFLQAGQTLAQNFMQYLASQPGFAALPGAAATPPGMGQMPPEFQVAVQALSQLDMAKVKELQARFLDQHVKLWNGMLKGGESAYRVEPEPGDRRFNSPAWRQSPVFDYL